MVSSYLCCLRNWSRVCLRVWFHNILGKLRTYCYLRDSSPLPSLPGSMFLLGCPQRAQTNEMLFLNSMKTLTNAEHHMQGRLISSVQSHPCLGQDTYHHLILWRFGETCSKPPTNAFSAGLRKTYWTEAQIIIITTTTTTTTIIIGHWSLHGGCTSKSIAPWVLKEPAHHNSNTAEAGRFLPGLEVGLAKVTTARATGLHQGRRVAVQMGWRGGQGQVSLLWWHELDQFSCNMLFHPQIPKCWAHVKKTECGERSEQTFHWKPLV